jgi:hypothetical protein
MPHFGQKTGFRARISRMSLIPAVGNSPPFLRQSPFRTFRQIIQLEFEVDAFDEMFEMEIVLKKGMSGIRLARMN